MKFFTLLVCFVGLVAVCGSASRQAAGLVVYCALAALVCGLAAVSERHV